MLRAEQIRYSRVPIINRATTPLLTRPRLPAPPLRPDALFGAPSSVAAVAIKPATPHPPVARVPSAMSLRGASALLLALRCVYIFAPHLRLLPALRFRIASISLMRGSVIAFYRARWPTYDTFQSRQTPARETCAARQSLDRNSSKSVQHRIRALSPTPLEACSVQQHHVACDVRDTRCCARMTCTPPNHPTHPHTRPHLKKGRERALATTFSSTAVRTAESCFFGCPPRLLFSTLPMPALLERSIRLPAPLAARGDHLQHHESAREPPHDLEPP
ncbi:hypothetical protein B0H14DRAFT_3854319 [Mycena olivaceomarginata]|nr:hypothetical protein B0H14DRAFT_3854319 [Mycena olivaceomarginata]